MNKEANKENLQLEILANLKQIRIRATQILPKLLARYFFGKDKRTPEISYATYDKNWDNFWEKKDMFRLDLRFKKFGKRMIDFSPWEFRRLVRIKKLAETIVKYKITSVLEVGSGAGVNLIDLASMFPEVTFIGLEPTESGVRVSNEFIKSPPLEFEEAYKMGELKNVKIIKGSILDSEIVKELESYKFDLVYTVAVLEQLQSYIDIAFENIFKLKSEYFLFDEEWLEANCLIENYIRLVISDYFRISWDYLNKYENIEILERSIPSIQPAWIKYGVVLVRKLNEGLTQAEIIAKSESADRLSRMREIMRGKYE